MGMAFVLNRQTRRVDAINFIRNPDLIPPNPPHWKTPLFQDWATDIDFQATWTDREEQKTEEEEKTAEDYENELGARDDARLEEMEPDFDPQEEERLQRETIEYERRYFAARQLLEYERREAAPNSTFLQFRPVRTALSTPISEGPSGLSFSTPSPTARSPRANAWSTPRQVAAPFNFAEPPSPRDNDEEESSGLRFD